MRMSEALPKIRIELEEGRLHWWVKIVEYLQHNWALPVSLNGGMCVLFIDDLGHIFDWLEFPDESTAKRALARNGFEEFDETPSLREFLNLPKLPLGLRRHPNGAIYSSGRFWHS